MNMQKLLITGFMASGKTTFWKKLQNSSSTENYKFYDLDRVIYEHFSHENDSGLNDLIKRVGWETFRRDESGCLSDLLSLNEKQVICLGGGALNKSLINHIYENNYLLVWLDVDFKTCFTRMIKDKVKRPLLDQLSEEALHDLFNQRKSLYSKAQITLSLNDISQITTVHELFAMRQVGRNIIKK